MCAGAMIAQRPAKKCDFGYMSGQNAMLIANTTYHSMPCF
jgi:hypothetical protein